METEISHHHKIERLEAEKRQLEDRIRQLKHAAHTAERKRLTRAKNYPWITRASESRRIASPAHC
jgi:hypothetical protein